MFSIRPINQNDNPEIKKVILDVLFEHGATGGGFAGSDPELNRMFEFYNHERSSYFILEKNNRVVGGAGLSPLIGSDTDVCELQKMYFLKEARGKGFGLQMINRCLESARSFNYKTCYLETLTHMESAIALYKKVGFKPLEAPMGKTGHFGCNSFYSMNLL